jgi:sulfate transport system permease protein
VTTAPSALPATPPAPVPEPTTRDPAWLRLTLITAAMLLLLLFLVLPLALVFVEAFSEGWTAYREQLTDGHTWQAIKLTLVTAAWAVPLNTLFGVAAAYALTKYRFRGKNVLTTLIDLPFAVSPIVAGLALVLLFGRTGWFAPWLGKTYVLSLPLLGDREFTTPRVMFELPAIVLATIFITFPFVARELIPLMQSQGTDEETAARVLGAGGWQTFWRVTLPNIKWGLLYGVILCNARAMGEFGAVYIVSSRTADQITLPLRVERVFYETVISMVPVFATASVLGLLAVATLVVKTLIEWRYSDEIAAESKGRG